MRSVSSAINGFVGIAYLIDFCHKHAGFAVLIDIFYNTMTLVRSWITECVVTFFLQDGQFITAPSSQYSMACSLDLISTVDMMLKFP